jgi:hypothetical protein
VSGGAAVLIAFAVLFPVIFLVVGGLFVRNGLNGMRGTRRFEDLAARVSGQCVDLKLRRLQRVR